MKAALIHSFGNIDNIQIEEVPIPQPLPDEVQIKVHAAGLNPVDWKIVEGRLKERMPYMFPIIIGWDVAGIISDIGSDVSSFNIGDPIYAYCRQDKIQNGSCAEYICLKSSVVALKPTTLSFEKASCVPLSGLTAWQSLFDAGQLNVGEKVLIHAGAGGVGSFAIQFAKYQGAKVITTASEKNKDYVKVLGADMVIDYTQTDFVRNILDHYPGGIDLVFDTVGGNTFEKSINVIKNKGKIVSLLEEPRDLPNQIQAKYVFVRPDNQQLQKISNLFDQKFIQPPSSKSFPLQEIKKCLYTLKTGHVQGKLTIVFNN